MTDQTQTSTETQFRIDPATRPGYVHLTVADLQQQIAFYQTVLGFQLHWQAGSSAGLGAGGLNLLRLTEVPGARRVRGVTGLYHFAVLFPNRRELARAVARLFSLRYRNYPTDHIMTKTTYLDDPEGNGIELYTESPEDGLMGFANGRMFARRADGTPSDGREPLDLEALFRELQPGDSLDQPVPAETRIGHVHLHVADLPAAMRFYHGLLGLDDMGMDASVRMGMVSAGRYHHHIGLNTWVGEGAPPPPPNSLGLRYFSLRLPNPSTLDQVLARLAQAGVPVEQTQEGFLFRDPSQNEILLEGVK